MGIEYTAAINAHDYDSFRMILTTQLPHDYNMWLRVRDRGKVRALDERGVMLTEIEVTPMEFGAYCRGLKKRDFSIASLDRCARVKAVARTRAGEHQRPA